MKKSTKTVLWVGGAAAALGLGVWGYTKWKASRKAPAATATVSTKPTTTATADSGIFGTGVSADDVVRLVGLIKG